MIKHESGAGVETARAKARVRIVAAIAGGAPAAVRRATGARSRESATETVVAVRGADAKAAAAAAAVVAAVAVVDAPAPAPSLVSGAHGEAIALAPGTDGPEGDLTRVVMRNPGRSGRSADQIIVKSRRAPSRAASSSAVCRKSRRNRDSARILNSSALCRTSSSTRCDLSASSPSWRKRRPSVLCTRACMPLARLSSKSAVRRPSVEVHAKSGVIGLQRTILSVHDSCRTVERVERIYEAARQRSSNECVNESCSLSVFRNRAAGTLH